MLTESELVEKLRRDAEDFESAARQKQYLRAKILYDRAQIVAVTMQLPERTLAELFGQWGGPEEERPQETLFRSSLVEKVNYECCVLRNKTYQDIACRRRGEPLHFYGDEDYCAKHCRKSQR